MTDSASCARRDWADWSGNRPASTHQDRRLGGLPHLDGGGVRSQRRALRPHPLLSHRPFFLAMAAVSAAHGTGVISVGSQGWLWIGTAIAVGTAALWIVPERLFGGFLMQNRSG
jgi:hypothetical protein